MAFTKRQKLIAKRIQDLADQNNGRITPEQVITDAANTLSPLHNEFEWDDAKAAHAHRLDQARTLIRSVRVVVTESNVRIPVIAYVRDPSAAMDEQGYIAVPKLLNEGDLAREALQYEIERAVASLARAKDVARALGLDGEINGMRETLIKLRARLSEAA